METREWTTIDRAALGWPSGEWDGEPDKVQWKDEATGLPCLAVRQPRSGHWCGYVGVTEGHSAFQVEYEKVEFTNADGEKEWPDVHGGLTYTDFCQPHGDGEGRGVCHVPGPGEPDRVWWLGFDCAHSGDFCPEYAKLGEEKPALFRRYDSTYKSLAYVKAQCRKLAQQLANT